MSSSSETFVELTNWRRRIAISIAVVGVVVVGYTLLYQWAMATYEGVEVTFVHALRIVIEALTTAGFGGDTHNWESTPVQTLVILKNLSGVLLVFLALPLFVVPLFRQMFQTRPPTTSSLTDHVVICGYSTQDEILRSELEPLDIPYLYVDPDPDLVTGLTEDGINAVVGEPERIDVLESANVTEARAIVADIDDETNPTVILAAKQLNPDVRSVSVIRKPDVEPYHRYAKADEVVMNRRAIGRSLGLRAAGSYAEKLLEAVSLESDLQILELRIQKGSDLVGQSLREARILGRNGFTVIGAWLGGKFVVTPGPDTVIEEHTILLVVGTLDQYENMRARPIPTRDDDCSKVIVCGYGTVGRAITETLRDEGVDVTVVDIAPKDGVDVVGDIADPETFEQVDIENASAVVLSIDEDVTTLYATLIVNHHAPDAEIIVRADGADSVQKLYNAGADFVLSLPAVTGEILASILIDEIDILTPDVDFEFERIEAQPFAKRSLSELDIRRKTGCTVVAVERDGELLTDLGGDFVIETDDVLIVAGARDSQQQLVEWIESEGRSQLEP